MLKFVLKKMLKNKWLVFCLLIGSVMATSIISSIPMFSDGILQKVLIQDLNKQQEFTGTYPGNLTFKTKNTKTSKNNLSIFEKFEQFNPIMESELIGQLEVPFIVSSTRLTMGTLDMMRAEQEYDDSQSKQVKIKSMKDLEEHINILSGRMFDPEATDCVEVIVTEAAAARNNLLLDKEYAFYDYYENYPEPILCKVVGIFSNKLEDDPFWFNGMGDFNDAVVMDYNQMVDQFLYSQTSVVNDIKWSYALDYTQIPMSKVEHFISSVEDMQIQYGEYFEINYSTLETLEEYKSRSSSMSSMLWSLQIPIILMLVFYIFMVSQLIIDYEKNEIAVLKSRGASNGQIFLTYFWESCILGAVAWVVGPFIGYWICKILGLSNGFMELVSRSSLPIQITGAAFLYSLGAVLAFIITMMIPVMLTTRMSIVKLKQSKARKHKKPLWKRFYFDFILLGLSIYQIYLSNNSSQTLQQIGLVTNDAPIDPFSYMGSTMFVLGAGLLFLRLFPLLIRFVFWVGRRFWSPVLYSALTNVSRSQGQNVFLMLFLILTISLGVLNANSARTLNINTEERIMYNAGADIVIEQEWRDNNGNVANVATTSMVSVGGTYVAMTEKPDYAEISFVEPVNLFDKVEGIKSYTKVLRNDSVTAKGALKSASNVKMMAIEPHSFGNVAWFRSDLLPHHINEYLNLLAADNRACLISASMQEQLGVKVGDTISITWYNQYPMDVIVFGVIDYWPSINPLPESVGAPEPYFMVTNLSYVQRCMKMEPYKLWIKKAPGVTSEEIYNSIQENKIRYVSLSDASQKIVEAKNDPLVNGTNGMLTLGFLITMMVSFIGFLIYWVLNVKSRVLQFGILRSMGMTKWNLISILIWEQILMSLVAIILGFLLGDLTSYLFVPLLQQVSVNGLDVPPFRVISEQSDYIKIYITTAVMMLVDLTVLSTFVSKIKMSQALKLGED